MSLLRQASKMFRNDVQVPPMPLLKQLMNGHVQTSRRLEVAHPTTNEQVPPKFQEIQPMKDEVQVTQRPDHTTPRRTDVPILHLFELTQPKKGMQVHNPF